MEILFYNYDAILITFYNDLDFFVCAFNYINARLVFFHNRFIRNLFKYFTFLNCLNLL